MPGIFGFSGATASLTMNNKLMDNMANALRDEDNYQVDSFVSESVGLGRIHLGIIDKTPQPLWSADGSVALVLQGEIFSWDSLVLEEPVTGKEPDFSNAALLLAAYMQFGEEFVHHVNGTFAAAIWNAGEHALLLVTDIVASYPLYYTCVHDRLVFAAGARAAVLAPGLQRVVDPAAIAELLVFEHVYHHRTLFSGVAAVPPGTVLRFCQGSLRQSRYADLQYPEYYEMHEEGYYIEGYAEYLHTAVSRQARGPGPQGVLLTGGLDSRSIVGSLAAMNHEVTTLTFGNPGCDDELAAREIAQILNLPHIFLPIDPEFLAHLGAKAVCITDGLKSSVHSTMLGPLRRIVQQTNVLYKGFLGGTIHGEVVSHARLAPIREQVWFERLFHDRSRVFKESELPHLYTPKMFDLVQDVPRQSLAKAHAQSQSLWWVDKDSYVDLYQEDVGFTVQGVQLARSQALVRTPLADKDLLQFAMSVPPGYRADKNYYRRAVARAFPRLSNVPYSGTRRPLNQDSFRSLLMRMDDFTRWWLHNRGFGFVPINKAQPSTSYASWFRNQLRPWIEEILLSSHALDRGYFQPSYIRTIVAEHVAGYDHTRKLGVLLDLELWHRQFMD